MSVHLGGTVRRVLYGFALGLCSCAVGRAQVKAWEEPMVIPTYEIGAPDPDPMFYAQDAYQGAQKRIYPYPVQDQLTHDRVDKTYTALNLENEYITLIVLPEIGGRLFAATDKTNGYDFIYRQHVIKPALIGMLGAWISGGIEWCAFHHHRNTTFLPVDYTLAENADGSRTIWFGETERRHRMRWLVGLTLYPDKSYVEATVKFFNRTPQAHSILYWANVAVRVNDDYQIIFPPSVQVATYHSKIDFTPWPIGRGRYRGSEYTGLDISWWKNSVEQNSFFAWNLREDFMGGYDHGRQAGIVHVADHHLVCGAKLWEWGTGPGGRAWDKILTDTDGPYAELMVGAWSDNQPDYSWIKPYETKVIKQYWYPVRGIDGFKNANLNAAVNLELKPGNTVAVGFHATSPRIGRVELTAGGKSLLGEEITISPDRPFTREIAVPEGTKASDLRAALRDRDGTVLVSYQPVEREPVKELPRPVTPPPKPQDIKTTEELYLTGLRVEQIHSPSLDPLSYYEEALKRDPGDVRSNIMLGINCNKRGLYMDAEKYLRKAIERLAAEYTRPGNTEAYYQLGLALRAQGKLDEAYETFYGATWDQAFVSAAYHQLAELSCCRRQFDKALEQINDCLAANAMDTRACCLKAAILRQTGHAEERRNEMAAVLKDDPLNFRAANELISANDALAGLHDGDPLPAEPRAKLRRLMRDDIQAYLELAADYMSCGMRENALEILSRPVEQKIPFVSTYPLLHYYLGYLCEQQGAKDEARRHYAKASKMPSDYCFPFRLEDLDVLNAAIVADPSDARAHYYLGNLLYELQPERAIPCWEKARELDGGFAMVHRNLGWAYHRVQKNMAAAIESYEKAIGCNRLDPRLFYELDVLYEMDNANPARRLKALEQNHETVRRRQDALLREIMVLVLTGNYDWAIEYLANNRFHAREGAESIRDVYADAHLLKGLEFMKAKNPAEALAEFRKGGEYPENLAVGRPRHDRRGPQVAYLMGTAEDALGEAAKAKDCYGRAADQQGVSDWPEARYYQALSLAKLGKERAAREAFAALVEDGRKRLTRVEDTDFFAKFGEQETKRVRTADAYYAIGLGLLGQGEADSARREFEQAVKLNASHVWARYQLAGR
ncbi:MAG: DUF5107 domain-containing protein [Phycisphaerae bacterium]|nr:DUF5107 domain-containing protein [Phycisphaerae bacterium]